MSNTPTLDTAYAAVRKRPADLPPEQAAVCDAWRNAFVCLRCAYGWANIAIGAGLEGIIETDPEVPGYCPRWEQLTEDMRTLAGISELLLGSLECTMPPWLMAEAQQMRKGAPDADGDDEEEAIAEAVEEAAAAVGIKTLKPDAVVAASELPRARGKPYWQS